MAGVAKVSVRYIGSKARLIDAIIPLIGSPQSGTGIFVDAFCGTGVVAEAATRAGWSVQINDHLTCAVTMAAARLTAVADVPFATLGGYVGALNALNSLRPRKGFIWREYSPASERKIGIKRMYFTEANAARMDAIRTEISSWRDARRITVAEERLLLADLLAATNKVANIAGTYGCFLSHWSSQAKAQLLLRPRQLAAKQVAFAVSSCDVSQLQVNRQDVVYLDPPYTKRQYAAYYHILETLAIGDEPSVGGITGLRPWQTKASDYCYKSRALNAITELVNGLNADRVFLSYSNQGHVPMRPLQQSLQKVGDVTLWPLKTVGRYRPNIVARDAGANVKEYLLGVNRSKHADARTYA